MVPQILDNLTDAELKKEAKNESKNDAISAIIKAAKCIVSRVPYQEEMIKNLEILRLKMILRLLQISSFNGKMNALNEVNKVIASVNYYLHRNPSLEEEEWLTAERMAVSNRDLAVFHKIYYSSTYIITAFTEMDQGKWSVGNRVKGFFTSTTIRRKTRKNFTIYY